MIRSIRSWMSEPPKLGAPGDWSAPLGGLQDGVEVSCLAILVGSEPVVCGGAKLAASEGRAKLTEVWQLSEMPDGGLRDGLEAGRVKFVAAPEAAVARLLQRTQVGFERQMRDERMKREALAELIWDRIDEK